MEYFLDSDSFDTVIYVLYKLEKIKCLLLHHKTIVKPMIHNIWLNLYKGFSHHFFSQKFALQVTIGTGLGIRHR